MSKGKRWILRALFSLVALFCAALVFDHLQPSVDPNLHDKLLRATPNEVETLIVGEAKKLGITALSVTKIEANEDPKSFYLGRAEEGGMMQVASLSKSVAAAVIMMVADAQGVSLDDDIRSQITSLDISALGGGEKPVTLRQLLSHSSGASQSFYLGHSRSAETLPTTLEVIESPQGILESQLEFDGQPGEYRYSGGGYMIAQLWVEDVLDQPFARTAKERLFAPLGMNNSTFDQPVDRSDFAPLKLIGADTGFDPTEGAFHSFEDDWNLYPEQAAAGLWSTSVDYARFAAALIEAAEGADSVIPHAVASEMIKPQVKMGEGGKTHYGLGVMLSFDDSGALDEVSHSGANLGYRAYFVARPKTAENERSVVVAIGNTASASRLNRVIAAALLDR